MSTGLCQQINTKTLDYVKFEEEAKFNSEIMYVPIIASFITFFYFIYNLVTFLFA